MKRILIALTIMLTAYTSVSAQQLVLPIGKNATNQQSPSNPQCHELDINGLTYSATNPIPVQPSQGNSAVSVTNPLNVTVANNGAASSISNPLPVMNGNSTIPTFAASTGFSSLVATATDFVGIVGSASKTVKIQKIVLNTVQTTAGLNKIYIIVRSTADTGSTIVNPTIVPLDSGNSAATAVVNQYTTTNPTTGAAVGTIISSLVYSPILATGTSNGQVVLFDAKVQGQPIVLRGVAQECDLNFNGAAVPSGFSYSVDVFFTEN